MEIISSQIMRGPNIYSYKPVLVILLDLGSLDLIESNKVKGFNQILLKYFPGLYEHTCSTGKRGGFVRRLEEGTYLGHIIEHLALEIQYIHGYPVYYGKTIWSKDAVYKIIIEYVVEELAIFSLKSAVEIVEYIYQGKESKEIGKFIDLQLEKGQEINKKFGIGPSTFALIKSASRAGIPVIEIDRNKCLYQLGYGRKRKMLEATISSQTSCIAVDIASDKVQTRDILKGAALPVPRGYVVEKLDELKETICKLAAPVVVKPHNSNHGKGVSLYINNWYELKKSFYRARKYSDRVIIEEYIEGKDYRLLVVGSRVVAASERIPPHVVGDGEHTIEELIEYINSSSKRGDGHEKPLTRVHIDDIVKKYLYEQGLALKSIPAENQLVYLRYNGNLSTGGTALDVTEQVHPLNAEMAVRAAQIIGLDIAGIDIIARDIRIPLIQQQGVIIEINAAPGIRMHHFPEEGSKRDAAAAIVKHLFPEDNGRIPVVSITGTNGKTTTTRLLAKIIGGKYRNVGFTTTDGTYVNNKCIMKGDNTGPISAGLLLRESNIDIALLETARGGIQREGLGYKESDIAVITNISEDHLGVDGLETLDDLINVKSLVIETVRQDGFCVLNADDPVVSKLSERASAPIIYFSRSGNNIRINKHCKKYGDAVYIEDNMLIHQKSGQKNIIYHDIRDIPLVYDGLAEHNIENVLAAVAVSIGLGLEKKYIERGLSSFGINYSDNIGRLNIFQTLGLKVILDYGHNPAGFKKILEFIKTMGGERVIGIVGMPGDRCDELITKSADIFAKYLDVVIIKEDKDLRGREIGEVAGIIKRELNDNNYEGKTEYIPDEKEALKSALKEAERGDIIVCFYEKDAEELIQIIRQGIIKFETEEPFLEGKNEIVTSID